MNGKLGFTTFGKPFVQWAGGRIDDVTGFTSWPDGRMEVVTQDGQKYAARVVYNRVEVLR